VLSVALALLVLGAANGIVPDLGWLWRWCAANFTPRRRARTRRARAPANRLHTSPATASTPHPQRPPRAPVARWL